MIDREAVRRRSHRAARRRTQCRKEVDDVGSIPLVDRIGIEEQKRTLEPDYAEKFATLNARRQCTPDLPNGLAAACRASTRSVIASNGVRAGPHRTRAAQFCSHQHALAGLKTEFGYVLRVGCHS